jgi:hypothetical protein
MERLGEVKGEWKESGRRVEGEQKKSERRVEGEWKEKDIHLRNIFDCRLVVEEII